MNPETLKKYLRSLWMVGLKVADSVKWGLSMLRPEKTLSSRLVFGMACLCILFFVVNALSTELFTCEQVIKEMGDRMDKELKVAKIICDREQQKSDSTSTRQLFQMIQSSGIDSTYTLCLTDSVHRIVASTREGLENDSIEIQLASSPFVTIETESHARMGIVSFRDTLNVCLSDTISGSPYHILLFKPAAQAFQVPAEILEKVGISSAICLLLMVLCYLVLFFLLRRTSSLNKQMEGEMDVASRIQRQMVPSDYSVFPEKHGYHLHGFLQPAKTMGGDLLDYVLHDDKLYFCLGDVSGKGMPAALFMSQVHVLFRHLYERAEDPAALCAALNRTLSEGNDTNMFCTFFVGIIDFQTHLLSYCNAGHNQPVLVDASGKASFLETLPNIALGLFGDFPFQPQQLEFAPGSQLVVYTDGVTEAESLTKKVLGDDALLQVVSGKQDQTPPEMISILMNRIREHTLLAEQSDDIALLVLKREAGQVTNRP